MPAFNNDIEREFILSVQKEVLSLLEPVPMFIVSPLKISDGNRERVIGNMTLKLKTRTFEFDKQKLSTISDTRMTELVEDISMMELWKRAFLMRLQWIFQIIVVILIVSIVF